jgi:hypothetical protein
MYIGYLLFFLPLLFPLVDSEPWLDTGVRVVVDLIRLTL